MSVSGPNASKTSWRSLSFSLSRVSSSWLRTKLAHWLVKSSAGRCRRLGDGGGVSAREGQVHGLHSDEVELHVEPVAVRPAEERQLVVVREVHLAQQDGVAQPPGDEVSDVAEVLVGVEHAGIPRRSVLGEHEGNRVDAEARDPEFEPE